MHKSGIIKILALSLAAVSVIGMASCSLTGSESDEESTTERPAVTLEARPESEEQMLDYYNRAVNEIKASRPGVSTETDCSVGDVDTGDTPEAEALIQFAKNFSDALQTVKGSAEYGADLTDVLPLKGTDTVSRLTMADVESVELVDNEENQYVYEMTITLKEGKEAAQNAYDFDVDKTKILETFVDYKNMLEVSDYDVSYAGCVIHATIDKETNRVLWLRYERDAHVEAAVNFTGTLSSLGETVVAFTLHDTQTFHDFVWEEPASDAEEEDMLLG